MQKSHIAILAGLAISAPLTAAASPDYTYLRGDYIIDGEAQGSAGGASASEDYDGFNLGGSIAINPSVFAQVDYAELDGDDSNGDVEQISGGIGLNGPIATGGDALDAYGLLTYESIEDDNGNFDADGFGVTAGLRWMATPQFELNPYAGYVDYGSVDGVDADLDGWRFGVDGLFSVTEQFALTAGYRNTKLELSGNGGTADLDLENEIRIGVRFYFAGL